MQAREALKFAAAKFTAAGINTPALDARVLLQFASGKPREYFLAHPEAEIDETEFMHLVERRLKREPISHITKNKEFYGRMFEVSADVLTPRPETELIIDTAKEYLKASESLGILELGVGSGCIINTLMLEFPKSRGLGVDISNNALAIAKKNAYNLGIQDVEFYCSDWTEKLKLKKFDLVVSNPPYIKAAEEKNLEAELGYEPEIALYAGVDGLDAYRNIAKGLNGFTFRYAIFEIGQGQEEEVKQIFEEKKFELIDSKKIWQE